MQHAESWLQFIEYCLSLDSTFRERGRKRNQMASQSIKQQLNQKDKAVAIAPVQKRKSKSKPVHIVSDEEEN